MPRTRGSRIGARYTKPSVTYRAADGDGRIGSLSSYTVRRSRVHGRGLFARTPYAPGDLVGEYRGRVIDAASEDETSSARNADPSYTLLFDIDDQLTIDAGVDGNSIRFINHSCDPNCETSVAGDRVFVHALRLIEPDEELTYDYNLRPGDPAESLDAYACRCGSTMCRGTMIDAELLDSLPAHGRPTARSSSA